MRHVAQTLALTGSVVFLLVGCATIGPPLPPSLDLPQPPSDLRATRKGNRVNLSWTIPTLTTDRQTIRSLGLTLICRETGIENACETPVGEVKSPVVPEASSSSQKPQISYSDTLPKQLESDDPSAFASYAVQVLNRDHRAAGPSNQVRVSLARTLPPPRDFHASVAKQGIVLTWTGDVISVAPADVQYVYRIHRRIEGSSEQVLAGETPAGTETMFTFTDANIEWEKTYYYRAEAVTVIQRPNAAKLEIEGEDTPEIGVFAHDVFPPLVPSELQAVFSGPGQKPFIDLVWAPVSEADLAGYNIYRREEGTTPVKLNSELAKAPAYRDENVTSGKKYFYSVSAVDIHGNESTRSKEASEAVP
jgi:hypothetical protein